MLEVLQNESESLHDDVLEALVHDGDLSGGYEERKLEKLSCHPHHNQHQLEDGEFHGMRTERIEILDDSSQIPQILEHQLR